MVASILRDRILDGQLADGAALPRQEDLLREFGVSKPSMREALRILEAEGLISVRRGNLGGAIVHVPKATNAAYMIGLVLRFRSVPLSDVGNALKRIEPVCAGLCAGREDRHEAVLPVLWQAHEQVQANIDDEVLFTRASRRFHESLVGACGNQTLILVAGALESLWSSREERWAVHARDAGSFPAHSMRRFGVRAHERLLTLIDTGDAAGAERQATIHLEASLLYSMAESK